MNRREMMVSVAAVASGIEATAKVIDTPPALFVIEVPERLNDADFNRLFMTLNRLSERMKQNNGHGPEFLVLEQGAKIRTINQHDTIETPEDCPQPRVGVRGCLGDEIR